MELESVSLKDAWQVALDQFERDIHELHAVVTFLLPLPRVHAHAATLSQILANLLGNALKFVSDSVRPVITFKAEEVGDRVRITLEDNGTGIPVEYHEKIFHVFERLHRDRRDLNMPRKSGLEVIEYIRQQPALRKLVINVLSSSTRGADIESAAMLGANAYFIKPTRIEKFQELIENWYNLTKFEAFPANPPMH